jgi:hypothetical protein
MNTAQKDQRAKTGRARTKRPHLHLVETKPRAARPYKTLYYGTARGGEHSAHGASASEKGAIRAAVVRVFEEEHARAEIHDNGVLIYTVRRVARGIVVDYGSAGG